MSRVNGQVIGKRDQKGWFGRRKYFVKIRFERNRVPLPKDQFEYRVNSDVYELTINGAQVSGELAPVNRSLQYGATLQLLFQGRSAIA